MKPTTKAGAQPARYIVAPTSQIPDGSRMIVNVHGRSIGIFNVGGTYYALRNRCPHQGAQLCLGLVSPLIQSDAPGEVRFDDTRPMLQCPWHHWEFDLATGNSYIDPRQTRVRRYPVSIHDNDHLHTSVDAQAAKPDQIETQPPMHQTTGHLVPGPYTAETIPVTIEDDYVVLLQIP